MTVNPAEMAATMCGYCAEPADEPVVLTTSWAPRSVITGNDLDPRVNTHVLCETCAEGLRDEFYSAWSADCCANCGRLAGWGTEGASDGVSGWALGVSDVGLTRFTRVLEMRLGDGVPYVMVRADVRDPECTPVCADCATDYRRCDDCGYSAPRERTTSCSPCDYDLCDNCRDNHLDCYEDDGYDDDDDEFDEVSPAVAEALAAPFTPGRYMVSPRAFGVEMECSGGDLRGALDALGSMGGPVLAGHHSEHCGHEFVTIPLRGANGENRLRCAMAVLARHGWRPNDDCGTHFHLDLTTTTDAQRYRVIAALRLVEPMLYALATPRRASSEWCRPTATWYRKDIVALLSDSENDVPFSAGQHTRYCVVNSHALSAHGTVEVRVLDGTFDADRVLATIALAAGITDYALASDAATLRRYVAGDGRTGAALSLVDDATAAGHLTAEVAAIAALALTGTAAHRLRGRGQVPSWATRFLARYGPADAADAGETADAGEPVDATVAGEPVAFEDLVPGDLVAGNFGWARAVAVLLGAPYNGRAYARLVTEDGWSAPIVVHPQDVHLRVGADVLTNPAASRIDRVLTDHGLAPLSR